MKQYWTQLTDWLAQLQPRERVIVIAGAIVVAITILYSALWDPLSRAHSGREQALAESRHVASRLEVAAAELQRSRGAGGVNRNASVLSAIDQTIRSLGLAKQPRIQPEGEGDKNVNVWIEDVPFDKFVGWLNDLDTRYGIRPSVADIQRQSGVGLVNVHLTLARS